MPDLWMDVDSTLLEVPINILQLLDDTDYKTIETGLVYNQAGLSLIWNFEDTAGNRTNTAVTPTTGGGNYDWGNQGNGMYTIKIPASGGASINNDTEGIGWFTGYATGILPWRGPTIGFRAVALNNALIDSAWSTTRGLAGTALPDAVADGAGGIPISDAGGLDLDARLDAAISTRLATAGYTAPDNTSITAILADTNEMQGKLPTNNIMGSSVKTDKDDEIDAILTDTGTTIPGLIAALNDFDPATETVDIGKILGSSLTETSAGYLAAALSYFFNVSSATKTVNDVGVSGSGLTAADVWTYVTRTLTDKTGFTISGTKTTLDALNDIPAGSAMDLVNAPNATAITAIQAGLAQDSTVAKETTVSALEAIITLTRKHTTNDWAIIDNQFIVYDDDGTTPIATYNLTKAGVPDTDAPDKRTAV